MANPISVVMMKRVAMTTRRITKLDERVEQTAQVLGDPNLSREEARAAEQAHVKAVDARDDAKAKRQNVVDRRLAKRAAWAERWAGVRYYFKRAFAGRKYGMQVEPPKTYQEARGIQRLSRWHDRTTTILVYPFNVIRRLWAWGRTSTARRAASIAAIVPVGIALGVYVMMGTLVRSLLNGTILEPLQAIADRIAVLWLLVGLIRLITWLVVRDETKTDFSRRVNGVTKVVFDAIDFLWSTICAGYMAVAMAPVYAVDRLLRWNATRDRAVAQEAPDAPAAPQAPTSNPDDEDLMAKAEQIVANAKAGLAEDVVEGVVVPDEVEDEQPMNRAERRAADRAKRRKAARGHAA